VSHSAQRAFAAMLEAAANGELNFVEVNREYGNRAARVKKAFTDNGFRIIYDRDADGQPIGDGFFFTVGYGDMSSKDLQEALLRHGISSISLSGTGSAQQGVRVCVSMMKNEEDFERLEKRLKNFANEF
jgi:selenocysteine lyase/cysteine desulfurase